MREPVALPRSLSEFRHLVSRLYLPPGNLWKSLPRLAKREVELADTMPEGWQRWLDWHRVVAPDNEVEIKALEADRGSYLGYVRVVGRRQSQAQLVDHIVSLPAQYTKKPLLRNQP